MEGQANEIRHSSSTIGLRKRAAAVVHPDSKRAVAKAFRNQERTNREAASCGRTSIVAGKAGCSRGVHVLGVRKVKVS
jgi:hypothetical protein